MRRSARMMILIGIVLSTAGGCEKHPELRGRWCAGNNSTYAAYEFTDREWTIIYASQLHHDPEKLDILILGNNPGEIEVHWSRPGASEKRTKVLFRINGDTLEQVGNPAVYKGPPLIFHRC